MNDLLAPLDTEPAFKTRLRDAAVLVIPTDLRPEYDGPVFPDTTREVFRRLQEGLEDTATVDALVKDEDYVEYQYNSEQIQLPVLLVHSAVVSFVINILASYVYDRLGLGRNRMSDDRVASEIHVKRDRHGTQVSLRYEGPADTFESAVSQCLLNLDLKCDNEAPPSNSE